MESTAQRKTSSRSLNLDGFGGAGSKSMKRQNPGAASWDSAEASELKPKNKKRFVGVRQRPSGRWVAEIKDTTQKIRLWLGTFDSAEEGAKAYDSAARALRGANTRTNFVTAIACEGAVPATASKAARLIRLRQIAAAKAKACEKLEAEQKLGHGANQVISPLLRQDLNQQSSTSESDRLPTKTTTNEDEHHNQVSTPPRLISSSPLKPARQIGRRNNASLLLSSVKSEQGTAPLPASADSELDSLTYSSSLNLTQSAITSENLSNAINHSLIAAASPQISHLSSLSRLPLGKSDSPTTPSTSTEVPLLHNRVQLATTDIHLKSNAVDDGSKKHRLINPPPLVTSSVSTVEKNLVASLDPPQLSFSCSSNRADASLHASERLILKGIDSSPAVSFDTGRASCKVNVESTSLQSSGAESTSGVQELGSEIAPDTIPWSDYILVDGLDLTSCETNCGVYASAFDFSAEAMDRDSCTSSVLLEDQQYLSDVDSTEFLLTMPDSNPQLPGPPILSPAPETGTCCGDQSSGSTDTADVDECSSTEGPLWSSMDLAPLS